MITIGSLFSGIGGLELGLEWAGLGPVLWQVEIDPFCRRVLEQHWPDADRSVCDVRQAGAATLQPVDLICGGFPCQDISYAGKGAGLAGERSGLWFEFARIIGELGPRYVVVENVAALLARGMGVVCGTLADLGYDTIWTTVRASDVGHPHRRERVFIVAYTRRGRIQRERGPAAIPGEASTTQGESGERQRLRNTVSNGCAALVHTHGPGQCSVGNCGLSCKRGAPCGSDVDGRGCAPLGDSTPAMGDAECDGLQGCTNEEARPGAESLAGGLGRAGHVGDAECDGQQGCTNEEVADSSGEHGGLQGQEASERGRGSSGQTQPCLGVPTDGLPRRVAGPGRTQYDWEAPRTTEGCPARAAKLKALGNAVVPQCAEVVGQIVLALGAEDMPVIE